MCVLCVDSVLIVFFLQISFESVSVQTELSTIEPPIGETSIQLERTPGEEFWRIAVERLAVQLDGSREEERKVSGWGMIEGTGEMNARL